MRKCLIDRCELFNRLATVTAEDANDMKAKIYAIIQSMPAVNDGPETFSDNGITYFKAE